MPCGLKARLKQFGASERGAMLVFFAMSCAAIFVVAALSFDLGKRAATQTELQSFADNVALAAAGELDGMPDSILRAQDAARALIQDQTTFGLGDKTLAGDDDYTISFYAVLPANEAEFSRALIPSPNNDRNARFARVEVNPVVVEWSFARILSVFSSAALPSQDVTAEATAGYSGMACDVAPVFFCMPPAEADVDIDGIWDPANHIGDSIELVTTAGDVSNWVPGSLGFLDVTNSVDNASICADASGADLYNCLITVAATRSQCLQNGSLRLQDGLVPGVSNLLFNARLDSFLSQFSGVINDPDFSSAPIVTKPFVAGSTCVPGDAVATTEASGLPPDDCFSNGSCPHARIGDGNWSQARLDYVDANYSIDPAHISSVVPEEIISIAGDDYHINDPFRPGNAANPRPTEYTDYPVVFAGDTRWNYYNAEVAASYFSDPTAAYVDGEVDFSGASSSLRADPIDLLDIDIPVPPATNGDDTADGDNADGDGGDAADGNADAGDADAEEEPEFRQRVASSLPQCTSEVSLDPRRRALIAAAVDCGLEPLNGNFTAQATWFVELFLLDLADNADGTNGIVVNAEIISEGLQNSGASLTNGTFRNLVQLFR